MSDCFKIPDYEYYIRGRGCSDRGALLERRAQVMFELVKERLAPLLSSGEIHYICNCQWISAEGKSVGELDLVVLQAARVVAVVEVKSNCWELSVAFGQHSTKLMDASMRIVTPQGRDLLVERVGRLPEIFVVTIIPEHEYRLGAPPDVIQQLSEFLYADNFAGLGSGSNVGTNRQLASAIMEELSNRIAPSALTPPTVVLESSPDRIIVLM